MFNVTLRYVDQPPEPRGTPDVEAAAELAYGRGWDIVRSGPRSLMRRGPYI